MPPLLLRPLEPGEFETLYALDQQCFPPEIAYSRAEMRHFLRHASSFAIVAECGGEVAGFAIARSVRRRVDLLGEVATAFHIITIDVAPAWRRQAVGTELMAWIGRQARGVHARVLVLEAAVNNLSAHRFYERLGFQATGSIAGYYHAGLDALVFEKLLEPGLLA